MIRSSILGQGQPDDDPNFDFNTPPDTSGSTDQSVSPSSTSSSADSSQILKAITKAAPLLSDSDRAAIGSVAISVGAAVGTCFGPGLGTAIGTAIGAAIAGVTHFIKFSTAHYTWDQANVRARAYAEDVAKVLQSGLTSEQYSYLASIFPPMVKNFIASSNWWDDTTRETLLNGFDENVAQYGTSDHGKIWIGMWEVSIWIMGNFDIARPETLARDFMNPFLTATLIPAIQQTGTKYKFVIDGGGSSGGGSGEIPNTASMGYIVGGVLALVALGMLTGKKRTL